MSVPEYLNMAAILYISVLWLVILSHAQEVPIPPRALGYIYAYGKTTNLTAISIDAFYDPLCPDSKQAFPVLQQVAHHYGPDVLTLRLHMFPLPYHRNSYLASMGTEVVHRLSTSPHDVYDWMDRVYSNIYQLSGSSTRNMSETDVRDMLGDIGAQMGLQKSAFLQKLADPWVDMQIRMDWKYACTRGVSGTPLYVVNGVVKVISKTWSLADWKNFIDPLVHNSYVFHVPNQ